jgi:glycine cleavage system H protein
MHPDNLLYSPEHLWLRDEGNGFYRAGITYRYQDRIKSVVFVDLPEIGSELIRGEPLGAIESSKISTDIMSPISGAVVDVNRSVIEKPGLINKDPYGDGWLLLVQPADSSEIESLWFAAEYLKSTAEQNENEGCH